MFSLSARSRKSRTPGVEGTVYYVIKQGKSERNITGNIHGIDQSVISYAKERIAFDLMTIYCVIESIFQTDNKIALIFIAVCFCIIIAFISNYNFNNHDYQ